MLWVGQSRYCNDLTQSAAPGGISGGIFWAYAKIDEEKQVDKCSLYVPPPLPSLPPIGG